MRIALCIFLTLFFGRGASAGDHWPEFRGPDGQGHTDAKGLPLTWSRSKHVTWRTPIHDRGWSSPVVWRNQVWVTTATEEL